MSETSTNSTSTTESDKSSSSNPSSAPASPASTSTAKDSTASPVKSSSSLFKTAKSDGKAAASTDSHKREGSTGSLSSLKASLDKVKSAASNSSSDSPASAAAASNAPSSSSSSSSSSTNWTSVLTFGLASSKGKADLTEWLPDLTDKLPANLFTLPPPNPDGKPAQPALPADAVTPDFPNFTSLLPPPPPPSSALRFGWIDEYGDYHPASGGGVSGANAKLNVKLLKAREAAKELIASVMAAQEKLEKDKEPHSPRMSAIVKERLSIEGERRDSRGQGVERLVQVVEGSKGEKKVVVTEDEKVPEDL